MQKKPVEFTHGSFNRVMGKFVELNGRIGKAVTFHKIQEDRNSALFQFTEFYPNGNRLDVLYRVVITEKEIAVLGEDGRDCLDEVIMRNGMTKSDASRIFSELLRLKGERRSLR